MFDRIVAYNQKNLYLFNTLYVFVGFCNIFDGDVEQLHLAEELWQSFLHELLFTGLENLFLRALGHKVAQTTLIVDNLFTCQLLVGLHCRIRVHLEEHTVLTD